MSNNEISYYKRKNGSYKIPLTLKVLKSKKKYFFNIKKNYMIKK